MCSRSPAAATLACREIEDVSFECALRSRVCRKEGKEKDSGSSNRGNGHLGITQDRSVDVRYKCWKHASDADYRSICNIAIKQKERKKEYHQSFVRKLPVVTNYPYTPFYFLS